MQSETYNFDTRLINFICAFFLDFGARSGLLGFVGRTVVSG